MNDNVVWEWLGLAWGEDLDTETDNTLPHADGSLSLIDEVLSRLSRSNKITSGVLLSLGSHSSQLTSDGDFDTKSTGIHNNAHDAVSSSTDWESTLEFVSEGFALGGGVGLTLLEGSDEDVEVGVVETEALLDEGLDHLQTHASLSTSLAHLAGVDDDDRLLSHLPDDEVGVAAVPELSLEELVELTLHEPSGDNLVLGGHLALNLHLLLARQQSKNCWI